MAVRNYSLKDYQFIWGPIIVGGYGESGGIRVEMDENAFEYSPNADGGGTRSANSQRSATITLTLSQASPTNPLLSAQALIDSLTGTGVLPWLLRDMNGTSLFAATSMWVQKEPNVELNKTTSGREWVFRTDDLSALHGSANEAV